LDPTVDGGVIDRETALRHHFFKVAIAERVAQVPPYTKQDDCGFMMPPLEGVLLVQCGRLRYRCSPRPITVADATISCNRAGKTRLALHFTDINDGARRLYEREGFRVVRTEPTLFTRWLWGYSALLYMEKRLA
jgi:hypothetical protein